ncbi:MAG: hypothetical protein AMXMBFR81_22250 [Chthonomonas sp.]
MRFKTCWTLLLATLVSPAVQGQLAVEGFVSGIFRPVAMVEDPSRANRFFVVMQDGRIRIVEDGVHLSGNFLDIRSQLVFGGERGLLGLAFDPSYHRNGYFYVYYTFATPALGSRVVRYTRDVSDERLADPASASLILEIEQPDINHNGGTMHFDESGLLVLGLGDGGVPGDTPGHAQNLAKRLGSFMRINVETDDFPEDPLRNYGIPDDNPFSEGPRPSIWSKGWRNPWQWHFDYRSMNGLGGKVIADVGEATIEELNYEPPDAAGRNYGWNAREGTAAYIGAPSFLPLTDPVFEYTRAFGGSIIGGFIYRGTALGPEHYGRIFFGDFVSRRVGSVFLRVDRKTGEAVAEDFRDHSLDLDASGQVGPSVAFARDRAGEMFLIHLDGRIQRIVPDNPEASAVLDGRLVFEGLGGTARRPDILEVVIRNTGDAEVLHTFTLGPGTNDAFRIPVPRGRIAITVQGGTFLRQSATVNASDGTAAFDFELRNGDVNGDNVVNVQDFLLLRQAFGAAEGNPAYSRGADLNGDGTVNVQDFLILRSAFGRSGD